MSISYIEKTKIILWGKAAGRCQYEGCNIELYEDPLTKSQFNQAYIAHIVADQPGGPRGDKILSPKLKDNIDNLMLLCDSHHRLIDKEKVLEHTVDKLVSMKKAHETRIRIITGIKKSKEAHIILYGANIGSHSSPLRIEEISPSFIDEYYPSNANGYELGLENSLFYDNENDYWILESVNLEKQFESKIRPLIIKSNTSNYCVYGIAPQPLLIKLGTLLKDLKNVNIYNLQKEPKTWRWAESTVSNNFIYQPSNKVFEKIALVFSLSAQIADDRIVKVLGNDVSIYQVTLDNPNNDFLKTKEQLIEFRKIVRNIFDDIKFRHGEKNPINIFPAMQPGAAIEIGRVWYPKADLPLIIYDQNKIGGGFIKTIEIK